MICPSGRVSFFKSGGYGYGGSKYGLQFSQDIYAAIVTAHLSMYFSAKSS
jgi:hypothetical protein